MASFRSEAGPNPCRYCEHRALGCHARCEAYLAFARRRTAEREERQRAGGRASDLIQYRLALKRRVDQRNGHDGR